VYWDNPQCTTLQINQIPGYGVELSSSRFNYFQFLTDAQKICGSFCLLIESGFSINGFTLAVILEPLSDINELEYRGESLYSPITILEETVDIVTEDPLPAEMEDFSDDPLQENADSAFGEESSVGDVPIAENTDAFPFLDKAEDGTVDETEENGNDAGKGGQLNYYWQLVSGFVRKYFIILTIAFISIVITVIVISVVYSSLTVKHNTRLLDNYVDSNKLMQKLSQILKASDDIYNSYLYEEKGKIYIKGVCDNESSISLIESDILRIIPKNQVVFDINTVQEVQTSLVFIRDSFHLECDFRNAEIGAVCSSIVRNMDVNTVSQKILSIYTYNMVYPLTLNLYASYDITRIFDRAISSNRNFSAITYSVGKNTVYVSGYISQEHSSNLKQLINSAILTQNIKIKVDYSKLKFIEDEINLQIRQINFSQYGNVIIDNQNHEYGVGSHYKQFVITQIGPDFVVFAKNGLFFSYKTPFSSQGGNEAGSGLQNVINAFTSSGENSVDKTDTVISHEDEGNLAAKSSVNPRSLLLNEEAKKLTTDIADKQKMLKVLQNLDGAATKSREFDETISNIQQIISFDTKSLEELKKEIAKTTKQDG